MIFHFDQYTINAETFEAFRNGERLRAEPQVLDLLIFLLQNRHRVVTKEEVFEVVWKGRLVADATLASRMRAVRQLIDDDGLRQRFIQTIRGRGFRFVHEVRAEQVTDAHFHKDQEQRRLTDPSPEIRYARSGAVHVAYQLFGDGPVNLILAPGFVSHIDNYWDYPPLNRWLTRLGQMARVAMFDKRGTGLSDPVPELPDMDQRIDDVRAVMDAAQFEKAVIMGVSEGGSLASLFAAIHPERTQGLLLYGAFAQFESWFPTEESLQELFDYIETDWGTGKSISNYAPSVATDPELRQWWGKFERLGATPGEAVALMRMNSQIDISGTLSSIQAPTMVLHRSGDVLIDIEGGRTLARRIPDARIIEYPGPDHLPFVGDNVDEILAAVSEFLADLPAEPTVERTLATVVVATFPVSDPGSSDANRRLSDHRQRDRMLRHAVTRYGGSEIEFRDDQFIAAFDAPARALKCALDIVEEFDRFHLPVHIGVHTGELQIADGGASGIGMDIASQVAGLADRHKVVASRTVKDLVAGSGIRFADIGEFAVLDSAERWQMFQVLG